VQDQGHEAGRQEDEEPGQVVELSDAADQADGEASGTDLMKQADVGLGEDGLRTDVHQQQIQPVEDPQGAADAEIGRGQKQRRAAQAVQIAAGGQPAEKHRQKQRQHDQYSGDDGDRGPGQPDTAGRRFHEITSQAQCSHRIIICQ